MSERRMTGVRSVEIDDGQRIGVHQLDGLRRQFHLQRSQGKAHERAMANIEFGFGEGGYQPTEFIKRYLPDACFDLLVIDEGHEYKNSGSAQGQMAHQFWLGICDYPTFRVVPLRLNTERYKHQGP